MNIAALARQFDEEGYIVVEDFFAPALMEHLDRVIRAHFGDSPDFRHNEEFLEKSYTEVVPWFPQREGHHDFDSIEQDKRLRQLTTAILGEGWAPHYCMVMFSRQGSTGQAWHQDCPPEDPARHNLNRLVYTRDIGGETGGQTVVVPGSHKRGELPAGDPVGAFDGQVVLRPKKGTLVILHGHSWHRVLPIKRQPRFSTNFRAAPAGTPEDITDVCVYRNMRYRFSDSSVLEEREA